MRFVPTNAIRPGMINAKPLYGINQEILLREGIRLTSFHIERISQLGYNGIYAEDYRDQDQEYQEIISFELRMEAVTRIKQFFLDNPRQLSPKAVSARKKSLQATIEKLLDEILENSHLMVNMIDLKVFDDYTYYHSVNVTVISLMLGVALGLSREELSRLGMASLLHDVGKIMLPKTILDKPGRLTEEEFSIIQTHSEEGYRYLKEIYDLPIPVYMAVRFHHEQVNGTGYPMNKSGPEIPLFARIICIADVFDALTSDRVYRKALSPSDALEYVMAHSNEMFDRELVKLFIRKVSPYPVGTAVLLSDQRVGIIQNNVEGFGLRPLVQIIKHETLLDKPYTLDLLCPDHFDVTILDIYREADIYDTPDLFPDLPPPSH